MFWALLLTVFIIGLVLVALVGLDHLMDFLEKD